MIHVHFDQLLIMQVKWKGTYQACIRTQNFLATHILTYMEKQHSTARI